MSLKALIIRSTLTSLTVRLKNSNQLKH